MYYRFFIHSSVDGHVVCFHVLAVVNSAAMNTGSVMVFLGYMPNSGIGGSFGSFIPRLLGNLYTVFHSGYIHLYSHQQCKRVPFFPHLLSIYYLHMLGCWPFWVVWGDISW